MKPLSVLCVLILLTFDATSANRHTYGTPDLGSEIIFHKKVLDEKNEVPKNYTILFKYMMGKLEPLTSYFEIDVNVFSKGSVEVTNNDMKQITATISIPNARNVEATILLRGFGKHFSPLGWPLDNDDIESKSLTIIYVKNATATPTVAPRVSTIGKRQLGDQIIHSESRNVTNRSRFPSTGFEFSSNDLITCLRFSFNSPTAVALINTTFVSEKEFSAIAYDMNTEHFVVNMSVYGYHQYNFTPSHYVNLLGE